MDDEPVVRQLALAVLNRAGHAVVSASSSSEALNMYENHRGDIDVVISDVSMPGMNGRDLASYIRKRALPMPMVLMSGYPENSPPVMHLIEDARLDDFLFLPKPFTPSALIAAVRRARASALDMANSATHS